MKTQKQMFGAMLSMALFFSACGGGSSGGGATGSTAGGTSGNADSSSNTNASTPSAASVPSVIKTTLDSVCSTRPTPVEIHTVIGAVDNNGVLVRGQKIDYKEVLVEEDEGGSLGTASSLLVRNKIGKLYVEPSSDGLVYWAARKWAFADDDAKAKEALKEISISAGNVGVESQVLVNHPQGIFPNIVNATVAPSKHYEVCLVLKAPADWAHNLESDTGSIQTKQHNGNLTMKLDTGSITASQHSNGIINVESSGGVIDIDQKGEGTVTVKTSSGNINVKADSNGGVDLTTNTGLITFTMLDGGSALKRDSKISSHTGTITFGLPKSAGLRLDAEVNIGSIKVPPSFPPPDSFNTTGQKLLTDVNGGGATFTVRIDTGSIDLWK